jgi:murein DD-endopeptidase MepM/ murein hydrolase activator NlpD
MKALLLVTLLVASVTIPVAADIEVRDGLGFDRPERDGPCLTEAQRQAIWADLHASIERLRDEGSLVEPDKTREVLFGWPLRAANGLTDPGYHGVSGFVDHDPATGSVLDYNCGNRSYDLPEYNYNHRGTDFFTWPFPWHKMDHDHVEIVSAAPGTIIDKSDGHYDRNCGFGAGGWNAVYVRHADASIAWYGHMKNGSVTDLPVGSPVEAGDYLGVIGSSGNSTGPHLHLEVYDGEEQLIDPYAGPCNSMNAESWWVDQRQYYDSAINAVMTHDRWPTVPPCPETEEPHTCDVFQPGMSVVMIAYHRDLLAGQAWEWDLYRPDESIALEWDYSLSNPPHQAVAPVSRPYVLPEDAMTGMWPMSLFNWMECGLTRFPLKP